MLFIGHANATLPQVAPERCAREVGPGAAPHLKSTAASNVDMAVVVSVCNKEPLAPLVQDLSCVLPGGKRLWCAPPSNTTSIPHCNILLRTPFAHPSATC